MIRHYQKGMWTIANKYAFGPFCGERVLSIRSWKTNPLFKRSTNGFSIGPILFWKRLESGAW